MTAERSDQGKELNILHREVSADGEVEFVMYLLDAELDPVAVRFDANGCASFDFGGNAYRYFILDPIHLQHVAAASVMSRALWAEWHRQNAGDDPPPETLLN